MNILLCLHVLGFPDVVIQMSRIDDMMKEEANNLHEVIDALHVKHQEYTVAIQNYISSHLEDQSEITRIAGLFFFFHIFVFWHI